MRDVTNEGMQALNSPTLVVEVGDEAVRFELPGRLTVTGEGVFDVSVWAAVDRERGKVVVTRLEVSLAGVSETDLAHGLAHSPGITSESLHSLPLAEYVTHLLTTPPVAVPLRRVVDGPPRGRGLDALEATWRPTSARGVSKTLARAARRRSHVAPARKSRAEHVAELQVVADAVAAAPTGTKTAAAEAAVTSLGYAASTAKRWVREARAAGLLLEPRTRTGRPLG